MWVDNSHTMKASELKGRRLMKNTVTGETRFEISPEHHALLDDAEREYLEKKVQEAVVSEIVATTTQSRKRGKKNGS